MELKSGCGCDIGTSYLVVAREVAGSGETSYTELRDAFFRIVPPSPVAAKMIEKGLANQKYFRDSDGSFVVVGQDAIERAVERRQSASRPMHRGILSPKEPDARRILKFLLSDLLGQPRTPGEKVVFSVPAQPVNQGEEEFNGGYHEDAMRNDLSSFGYSAVPINEAEAICYSELGDSDYTGVSMSWGAGQVNCCVMSAGEAVLKWATTNCLAEDTLIRTQGGLVPISRVKAGDLVMTAAGVSAEVDKVIDNGYRSSLFNIEVEGYSEITRVTADHRLLGRMRGTKAWEWLDAVNISPGDLLAVPIPKPSAEDVQKSFHLYYDETGERIRISTSREFGQFLGYFLGDGTAYVLENNKSDGRVAFSFNTSKPDYKADVEKVSSLIKVLFNKEVYYEHRELEHCLVLKFSSVDLAHRLKMSCYDEFGNKTLPLSVEKIPHQMALGIVEGLLASDGWSSNGLRHLEITSANLAIAFQDLAARFGIRTTFTVRSPRPGGINARGNRIEGTKTVYRVSIGHQIDNHLLDFLIAQPGETNLPITELDYMSRMVLSIQEMPYYGRVYDLSIASTSHSFSSPGAIFHNCGDWIDRMAAQSTGETDSVVQIEKEHGDFTVGQENPQSRVLSAVAAYYIRLIDYVAKYTELKLGTSKELPKFSKPLPFVIAGGTSLAKGFIPALENRLRQAKLPIQISQVRHATDPLRAVARGCLVASSL